MSTGPIDYDRYFMTSASRVKEKRMAKPESTLPYAAAEIAAMGKTPNGITRYNTTNLKGQRITLVPRQTHVIYINENYSNPSCPLWGSEWQAVGLVKDISPKGKVLVFWGNGNEVFTDAKNLGIYRPDLPREKPGPNQAFKQGKRRGDIPDPISKSKTGKSESLWPDFKEIMIDAGERTNALDAGTAIHEQIHEQTDDSEPDAAPDDEPNESSSYKIIDDYYFAG